VGVCVCGRLKRSLCRVRSGWGMACCGGWSGLLRRVDREDYSCSAAASASRYVRFSVCTHRLLVRACVCVCDVRFVLHANSGGPLVNVWQAPPPPWRCMRDGGGWSFLGTYNVLCVCVCRPCRRPSDVYRTHRRGETRGRQHHILLLLSLLYKWKEILTANPQPSSRPPPSGCAHRRERK